MLAMRDGAGEMEACRDDDLGASQLYTEMGEWGERREDGGWTWQWSKRRVEIRGAADTRLARKR